MTLDDQINDARLTEAAERIRWTAGLESLAAKWEREGDELIDRASTAPTWEQDAAWRNSGVAAHRCAKELRAQMEKLSNDQALRSAPTADVERKGNNEKP